MPVSFVILSHLLFLLISLAKILFIFVSQIKNANLCKKNSCFYDVASRFTNIPLQETIGIAINIIFNHNSNLNLTRKELFLFATSQTHFIFNSKFYNQIDGVAMVSPLAPVLLNIFMEFHASSWLNECNLNKPNFYLRYVDSNLAINIIFNHNSNLNITRKELFLFATSQTHFIFNSKFYNQIDGVAMVSPLAPVLPNIFMEFHESSWLNECNLNKPKFYLRYVDNILAPFDIEQDSFNFLDFCE